MEDKLTARNYLFLASIILVGIFFFITSDHVSDGEKIDNTTGATNKSQPEISVTNTIPKITKKVDLEEEVLPAKGVTLPVVWGDLGQKLTEAGVIDYEKFKALYIAQGQYSDEYKQLLEGQNNDKLVITKDNASYLLNLFWALGLASKNPILEDGEMADPRYGGAGGFASTGGWTLAVGGSMDHYSQHIFFNLTLEQQALVDKVASEIYRPCCGNSTHFPDCNHGMAMLGLLELMASQGIEEEEMYQVALSVNSYWFPTTYLTIATYMQNKGVDWKDVSPSEMLGLNYSSGSGYARIASQVILPTDETKGGGACSI